MIRIVFLDRGTIGPSVTLNRPSFPHEWVEFEQTQPNQVVERLRDCDIAVCNKVPIRREAIAELPRLKLIVIPATGYDVFDIEACRERGIVVSNVREYAINTVPEHTFALILALRRNLVAYRRDVMEGRWQARRFGPKSSAISRTFTKVAQAMWSADQRARYPRTGGPSDHGWPANRYRQELIPHRRSR